MPAIKSDLYITVWVRGKTVLLGGVLLPDNKLHIKRGSSWSRKQPTATVTQIYAELRRWTARELRRVN